MPFWFACPHCGLETLVADRYAGQSGPCARCGRLVAIPSLRAPGGPGWRSPSAGAAVALFSLVLAAGAAMLGLLAYLLAAGPRGTRDARQVECAANLRRIGAALYSYHRVYGAFPPAVTTDGQGRPMHSWRVLILPFLGEQFLYSQYDKAQPWNSPSNSALVARVPGVYCCPAASVPGETNYLMLVGPGTVGGRPNESVSLADIRDGASNTLVVVEVVGARVRWTEPRDLPLDAAVGGQGTAPGQGPSSAHAGGINVLVCDGSVQVLLPGVPAEMLRGMCLHSDGSVVDWQSYAQPAP